MKKNKESDETEEPENADSNGFKEIEEE